MWIRFQNHTKYTSARTSTHTHTHTHTHTRTNTIHVWCGGDKTSYRRTSQVV